MPLDLVHDLQQAYRKTLDSMSRPGLISNIKAEADKIDLETGCFKSTMILVLMLFDTEVTFKVISQRENELTKLINQLTYAKAAELKTADFILVMHDALPSCLEKALQAADRGTLLDPHRSATVIAEADALSGERGLTLTGPGIDGERHVKVQIKGEWLELRAEKNAEYPLGIDLIFTDAAYNLLCLPRTTEIMRQVVG